MKPADMRGPAGGESGKERKGNQGRVRLGPSAGLICGLGRRGKKRVAGGKSWAAGKAWRLGLGRKATR
jgi:hypothetical protein